MSGDDSAPSAGWLFRAAIAACDVTLIAMRAAMLGVELTDVQITIDSESNDHGILGIDESVPAGPLSVRTRVRLGARNTEERVAARTRRLVDRTLPCVRCNLARSLPDDRDRGGVNPA